MTTTPLGQTEITGAQSQAEVYLDRNMAVLEGALGRVKSRTTGTAPGSEAEGDAYIIPAGSTWGAYGFAAGNIALYSGGGYVEVAAAVGHRVRVEDEGGAEAVYVGTTDVVWYGRDAVTTQTSTYTAGAYDTILGDASGGVFTVTLPAAADAEGLRYTIRNVGASGAVTVDGDGAETIDGGATATVSPDEALVVVSDGAEWWSVSSAASGGGGGAALDVTDGSTTVSSTDKITFAGATVTDQGGGDALVTINAATGDPADLVFVADGTSATMYLDVSGLPAGDLEISIIARSADAAESDGIRLRFGTTSPTLDSGSNYTVASVSTTADSAANTTVTDGDALSSIYIGQCPAATATASQVGAGTFVVQDFKGSFHKSLTGALYVDFNSGSRTNAKLTQWNVGAQWRNTAAIGVVGVVTNSGSNWVAGSKLRVRVKGVPNGPQLIVSAYRNAALSPTTSQAAIVWDTAPINVGTALNTSTGLFTAPSAGTYRFRAKAQADSGATTGTLGLALVDDPGGTPNELDVASVYHDSTAADTNTVLLDFEAVLAASDTVNIQAVSSVAGGLALQVGDKKRTNLQITRLA